MSDYGLGLGYRPCHFADLLGVRNKARRPQWLEAITENFLRWDLCPEPRALSNLLKLREDFPIALHGVSLSLGSTDPLSQDYLTRYKSLVSEVEPIWISDHLCWTSHGGENLHDLLPLPYTNEALDHVAERIMRVQDALGRRMLIENVSSYAEFSESEMSEWDFLAELAERADCAILLDVNNVFVASQNHRFDPLDYLRAVPWHRVKQIHLAGHSRVGEFLIDTHDAPVCPEVWELYRWTVAHHGSITAMIEWDSKIPPFEELMRELNKAETIHKEFRDEATPRTSISL